MKKNANTSSNINTNISNLSNLSSGTINQPSGMPGAYYYPNSIGRMGI